MHDVSTDLSKAIAGQVPAEFALGSWSNSILLKSGRVALHKQQMSASPSQTNLLLGQQAPVVHSVISGRSRSQTNKCIKH